MRSPCPLAAALAGFLALAAPLAVHAELPAHPTTFFIQSLASLRATPPIGAGLDASLQRGCVLIPHPGPALTPKTSGWKHAAAHAHTNGPCNRPARWRA